MSIQDLVKSVTDRIQATANVRSVYGEPIAAEGKTIIPVARVRYGFGGGGGRQGWDSESSDNEKSEQTGGGGGVEVTPIGFIEVTPGETRYVSFEERRRIVRASLLVLILGIFLLRRRRRG